MNTAVGEPSQEQTEPRESSWSPGRLCLIIALIFAAHLGLIFIFGERKPITSRPPSFAPELSLVAGADEFLAENNPTLFALPNTHGFSGAAWMRLPGVQTNSYQWSEPLALRWLPLPTEQLGTVFLHFVQTNTFFRFSQELKPSPRMIRPGTLESLTAPETTSVLRVEGELASRPLLNPPVLSPLPGTDLLTNSVVQVLVDEGGNVFSTTLLSSVGSKQVDQQQADQRALVLAKSSLFAPLRRTGGNATKLVRPWTLGRMIFQWYTVPLPPTNTPPAAP